MSDKNNNLDSDKQTEPIYEYRFEEVETLALEKVFNQLFEVVIAEKL